jgi:hypothetical protein
MNWLCLKNKKGLRINQSKQSKRVQSFSILGILTVSLFAVIFAFHAPPAYAFGDKPVGSVLGTVSHDWNSDGVVDRASLIQDREFRALLRVSLSNGRGGFQQINAPDIAESDPSEEGTIISLNPASSIVISESHDMGRGHFAARAIIAFRGGNFVWAGRYTEDEDGFTPNSFTACDVNYLNGRATYRARGVTRVIRHAFGASLITVPINNAIGFERPSFCPTIGARF